MASRGVGPAVPGGGPGRRPARYAHSHAGTRTVTPPGHGLHPVRRRDDLPGLGAARGWRSSSPGTFDGWAIDATPLAPDGDGTGGTWSADVPGVGPGDEYRFTIRTPAGDLSRMDPYARQVTSSVGNSVVYDPAAFDWGDDEFRAPGWDDLVIYEIHVGTFSASADRRGTFDSARRRLPYLRSWACRPSR